MPGVVAREAVAEAAVEDEVAKREVAGPPNWKPVVFAAGCGAKMLVPGVVLGLAVSVLAPLLAPKRLAKGRSALAVLVGLAAPNIEVLLSLLLPPNLKVGVDVV